MIREYTNKLVDLLDQGSIDPKQLAEQLLSWCSEDSVKQFYTSYGYAEFFEPEDEEEEADPMDDFNYVGSPHHY